MILLKGNLRSITPAIISYNGNIEIPNILESNQGAETTNDLPPKGKIKLGLDLRNSYSCVRRARLEKEEYYTRAYEILKV